MSLMFNGIGVSRGIGIAPTRELIRDKLEIRERAITKARVKAEIKRFDQAIATAQKELESVRKTIPSDAGPDISAFIETHLLMLADEAFVQQPRVTIGEQLVNAEWALHQHREAIIKVFEDMEDPYLATRKNDINHVVDAILHALQHGDRRRIKAGEQEWEGVIVVADDLTPADTIVMQTQGVAGFITETGGQLSHTAILARSLGIPAIVGVHSARRFLRDGDNVIMDGSSGLVSADPHDKSIALYKKRQREQKRADRELEKLRDATAETACGTPINLFANIENEEDIKSLRRANALGVGLYRTEFLYMNRSDIPSEEEHFQIYSKIIRSLKGAPFTIRTVDLGADKQAAHTEKGPQERNPALGLRGIRRCLKEPALFVPQLRAILRAAARGPVNILLPMLTNTDEVRETRALLEQVRAALLEEGQKVGEDIKLGGMIEVPSTAIAADQFAKELDFLSIGTNDLIQYTLAIDRIDDHVNYLYDPLHPAVLRLIKMTIDAGRKRRVPVSMCGEMAGDQRFIRLLMGLGLRDFSMPSNSLLGAKKVILGSKLRELRKLAESFVDESHPERRAAVLEKINASAETVEH